LPVLKPSTLLFFFLPHLLFKPYPSALFFSFLFYTLSRLYTLIPFFFFPLPYPIQTLSIHSFILVPFPYPIRLLFSLFSSLTPYPSLCNGLFTPLTTTITSSIHPRVYHRPQRAIIRRSAQLLCITTSMFLCLPLGKGRKGEDNWLVSCHSRQELRHLNAGCAVSEPESRTSMGETRWQDRQDKQNGQNQRVDEEMQCATKNNMYSETLCF